MKGKNGNLFLEKDEEQIFPVSKHDLKNVIVYQFIERKVLNSTVKLPAEHINAIGIYTRDEYEAHSAEGGLFDRLNLKHDVWHMPEPETEEVTEEEPTA